MSQVPSSKDTHTSPRVDKPHHPPNESEYDYPLFYTAGLKDNIIYFQRFPVGHAVIGKSAKKCGCKCDWEPHCSLMWGFLVLPSFRMFSTRNQKGFLERVFQNRNSDLHERLLFHTDYKTISVKFIDTSRAWLFL